LAGALPEKIGKYPIIHELGRGSSGIVYLAHDPFNQREVALKLASPENITDAADAKLFRKLFLNEATLAGKLNHPNIVAVYDAVVDEDCSYIVMEYVQGETLKKYCRADSLLPIEKVVAIVYKCCMALDFAHKHGVIHRDIKPANILLAQGGDIKITDFGVAQISSSQMTQMTGMLGSPAYMSPEQVREQPLTTQTDIYSLGVVMYEMLAGRLPHEASSGYAMIMKILNAQPKPICDFRSEIPPRLEEIVARAMSKDLETRYKTWYDFAKDLADEFIQLERLREDIGDKEKFNALRELAFFCDFFDEQLWEVVRVSAWEIFAPNRQVILEGDIGQSFYIIVQGSAVVSKGGRLLNALKSGDCFGEMSYLSQTPTRRSATITADNALTLVRIKADLLEQLSEGCQLRFNRVFLQTLVERLSRTNSMLAASGLPQETAG
jgi:CRP-like cAMP-binding protein/tRNA A-37 threonylcarbamoyl transferase component Bud32